MQSIKSFTRQYLLLLSDFVSSIILIIVVIVLGVALGLSVLVHICCAVKLCKLRKQRSSNKKEDIEARMDPQINTVTLKTKQQSNDTSTIELSHPQTLVREARYQTLDHRQLPDIPREYATII